MAAKFTDSQLRLLHRMSDREFDFVRGPEVQMCHRMELMGMVEGQLEPTIWDSRRGVTRYERVFRRTKDGNEVCRKNPQ